MLEKFVAFLDARMEQSAINPDPFERVHVAVAALLVEASRMDGHFDAAEQGTIVRIIKETLNLPQEGARELLALAEIRQAGAWHDWIFCQAINRSYNLAERITILEKLWELAASDGELHRMESLLLDNIADELAIPAAERERISRSRSATA